MRAYDIAVIGGGAAGAMAAIRSARSGKKTVLVEKNASIGKKILMTGAGRCNITNVAALNVFIEKFGGQGEFLRSAFNRFSNKALMDFFESEGLKLKSEAQGCVFPATDKSISVTETLKRCLGKSGVAVLYGSGLSDMKKEGGIFELSLDSGKAIHSAKVIMATGGVSYPQTGSDGKGLDMAKKLGHTIAPLRAALVPLRVKERWVKELQGVSLDNISITFLCEAKKIVSSIGGLMFTHFGVSGPLVLDLSGKISALLSARKEVKLFIDLKPGLDTEKLEKRLLGDLAKKGSAQLATIMEGLLPKRLAGVFMRLAGLKPSEKASQVTQSQRRMIIKMLKAFPLTIEGVLSIKRGMVTDGGISTKEINPRTMESRILPGLYFAGEIIDGAAPSGGYNLQQAFSTGFLAGESAANA